jgi:glyoxylase-like metal-dependent hydrolase (beta-lactamase superfamily II)
MMPRVSLALWPKDGILEVSRFVPGVPVDVSVGQVAIHRVLCPNASVMTGPGTNSYLVGEREMALVDPGPALSAHTDALMQALNGRSLRWIFVTHTHGDHSPGTGALRQLTGAEVIGLAPPQEAAYQDNTFRPNRLYQDGESILCDGFTIRLILTPGHVSNHVCFLLEEDSVLFTGDHILQGTTPVILPPDGDMTDYLASLEVLREMPLRALAPGHGDIMTEPEQMISTLIRHRQRREQKIMSAMKLLGAANLDTMVRLAYDDVPEHLLPWAKKTMLAHLIKLQKEGLAVKTLLDEGSEETARWQLHG